MNKGIIQSARHLLDKILGTLNKTNAALDLAGVWRIQKIDRHDCGAHFIDLKSPGIFIFTSRHYSMVFVLGDNPQSAFTERWNPTDREKIERFDSLIVNAGTYEISDAILTMHPLVARIPEFIGGTLVCECCLDGEALDMTFVDEYSHDGVQAPWVAQGTGLSLRLVRVDWERQ
jgi:hypothetical protein